MKFYIKDDENTMLFNPADMHHNRFFGQWSKLLTIKKMLNTEIQDKYYNEYASYVKANLEIESIPMCFDKCIQGVEGAGLSSDEKNCMRECFLKRVSSKDDFIMLAT